MAVSRLSLDRAADNGEGVCCESGGSGAFTHSSSRNPLWEWTVPPVIPVPILPLNFQPDLNHYKLCNEQILWARL